MDAEEAKNRFGSGQLQSIYNSIKQESDWGKSSIEYWIDKEPLLDLIIKDLSGKGFRVQAEYVANKKWYQLFSTRRFDGWNVKISW